MSKLKITPSASKHGGIEDAPPASQTYVKRTDVSQEYDNPAYSDGVSTEKSNGSATQKVGEAAKPTPPSYNDSVSPSSHSHIEVQLPLKASNGDYLSSDEDQDDYVEDEQGCFGKMVTRTQGNMADFWKYHGTQMKYFIASVFVLGYAVYFGYAMSYEFGSESSVRLLWMTLLGVFICIVSIVKDYYGDAIYDRLFAPIVAFIENHYTVCKILFIAAVILGFIGFLISVGLKQPYNCVSFCGYVTFLTTLFIFSANPSKVHWRPVLWGVGIQFVFALIVIRTAWGYNTFKWLGDRIQEFMAYTDEGSIFVFGESYEDHFFAFKVMPVVVFLSCVISVLYYLGLMQIVILKLAWIMQNTMGVTAAESVNAAGNIFIGQTEAPLLIRPMIDRMSDSELHAVMVGGFATIAGSVMATYILFGVPANHLVTASVMAAPCALGMSKLQYPEVNRKCKPGKDVAVMDVPPYTNVIEAASAGASAAIPLVANIIVNIIAFIALVAFFNTTLTWMGHRVGLWPPEYPELTFELICSYLLWPVAFLMGVAREDCRQVAELIGIKTFVNEMVAYTELGVLIDNTEQFQECLARDCTYVNVSGEYEIYIQDTNTTLYGGVLQDRSIVITTYALCGFANVASIGTVMGALGGMAPHKATAISKMTVRAMLTGTIVSFMNACVAGLLYNPELEET